MSTVDRSRIRVKAMLVALDETGTSHAVTLAGSDGSVVPVVWRPVDDEQEALPLFPAAAVPLVRDLTCT